MSQCDIDSSLRSDVYGDRVYDSTVSYSRHILGWCRVLNCLDENVNRILACSYRDYVHRVLDYASCRSFLATSHARSHHIVDQSFDDVKRRLTKSLMLVTAACMREKNWPGGNVAFEARVLNVNLACWPFTKYSDLWKLLQFLAQTDPAVPNPLNSSF